MAKAAAPRNRIVKLRIGEISAVDDPANPHAMIDLFKAKGFKACDDCSTPAKCAGVKKCAASDEMAMKKAKVAEAIADAVTAGVFDPEAATFAVEILKERDMTEFEQQLADAEARMDTLEKANEDLSAKLATATAERDEAVAKANGTGKSDEEVDAEVMKSLPAAVRDRLEAAKETEVAFAKMRDDNEREAAIAKARAIGVGKAEDVGALMVRVAKGKTTPEDAATLESLLKAASAQGRTTNLFKSAGVSEAEAVGGEPEDVLKAKTDELLKANPAMTLAQAQTAAFDANPALYDAINKARRSAAL